MPCQTGLGDITEMQVLLVGDIIKLLHVGVVPLVALGKLLVPSAVGDCKAEPEAEDDEDLAYARDHADNDARSVCRRLGREERVRADDVADRNPEEDGRAGKGLLGRSAHVARDEGQAENERRIGRASEVVPDQAGRDPVRERHEREAEDGDAGDTRHQVRADVHVVRLVVGVDREEDHDRDEGAVWDLKQGGLEGVEAEALDHKGTEIGRCAVGYIGEKSEQEVQVGLEILGPLDDLVPSQLVLLDGVVVVSLAAHDDDGLSAREPSACVWRVGEHDAHDDGPRTACRSGRQRCSPFPPIFLQTYPMIKNSYFQLARPLMCPIPNVSFGCQLYEGHSPYPMRPPSAIPIPFAEYHRPMTVGCCFRVNHMPVMATTSQRGSNQADNEGRTESRIGNRFKHACTVNSASAYTNNSAYQTRSGKQEEPRNF